MSYGKLAVDVVDDYKSSNILNPTCKDELIKIWKKHAQRSGLCKASRCKIDYMVKPLSDF